MTNDSDIPTENFSNAPISLAEHLAEKLSSSEPWTPREALISLLRDIDSNKVNPTSMVIVFDGPNSTFYVAAVKGFHKAVGMLTYARFLMMSDRRG